MYPVTHQQQSTNAAKSVQSQAATAGKLATPQAPTHQQIAERAHEIFVSSGSEHGHCTQNWQKAEHDLKQDDKDTAQAVQDMRSEGGASTVVPDAVVPSKSPNRT